MRKPIILFALSLTVCGFVCAQANRIGVCRMGDGPIYAVTGDVLEMGVPYYSWITGNILAMTGYSEVPPDNWIRIDYMASDHVYGLLMEANYDIYGDYELRAGDLWGLYMTWAGYDWYFMVWAIEGGPDAYSEWYVWRKSVLPPAPPLRRLD